MLFFPFIKSSIALLGSLAVRFFLRVGISQSTYNVALGVILGIVATLLFSIKVVLIKLIYQFGLDYSVLITLRMAFALPFYLSILFVVHHNHQWIKMNRRQLASILLLGVTCYYLASILDLWGLQFIDASLERFIVFLYPTFTLILSALFFQQRISFRQFICMTFAYLGVLLILMQSGKVNMQDFSFGMKSSWGVIAVFISALLFAFYLVFSERLIQVVGAKQFTALGMISACVCIIAHYSISGGDLKLLLIQSWEVYGLIFLLAFFSTVIPSLMMSESIRLIGSTYNAGLGFLGPIFTVIIAYIMLDEQVTDLQILGMFLVLLSLFAMKFIKID